MKSCEFEVDRKGKQRSILFRADDQIGDRWYKPLPKIDLLLFSFSLFNRGFLQGRLDFSAPIRGKAADLGRYLTRGL